MCSWESCGSGAVVASETQGGFRHRLLMRAVVVLVMRLWPRGIRKDRVTMWLRELGPVRELLHDFLHGGLSWDDYQRRYLAGLERAEAQAQVAEALRLAAAGRVTLLCGCANPERCHRTLLQHYLRARLL